MRFSITRVSMLVIAVNLMVSVAPPVGATVLLDQPPNQVGSFVADRSCEICGDSASVAEDFSLPLDGQSYRIQELVFWGSYTSDPVPDADTFWVNFYPTAAGGPIPGGNAITGCSMQKTPAQRAATGLVLGTRAEYRYTLQLPPNCVLDGSSSRYFVEIFNDTPDAPDWLWETGDNDPNNTDQVLATAHEAPGRSWGWTFASTALMISGEPQTVGPPEAIQNGCGRLIVSDQLNGPAHSVAGDGRVALVAGSSPLRVRVLDLTDPAAPIDAAEIAMNAQGLAVSAGHGFVVGTRTTSSMTGFLVINLADPENPVEQAWIDLPQTGHIEIAGPTAYVQSDMLYVYDISDPGNPSLRSTIDLRISGLTVGAGWGAALGGGGIMTLNFADRWNPTVVATAYHEGGRPAIVGNTAFSASFNELRLYDPQAVVANKLPFFYGEGAEVAAVGPWLIGGDDGYGLRVFDVLDPRWPIAVDLIAGPGRLADAAWLGDSLVIATFAESGLAIFDLAACSPFAAASLLNVAASGEGSNESVWSTDLNITNGSLVPVHVQIRFLPQNQDNAGARFALSRRDVAPLTTWKMRDVWGEQVGDGAGAVQIRTNAPKATAVSSRTFNRNDAGTFGQGIPGLSSPALYGAGERARVIRMTENSRFRGNLGMVNATAEELELIVEFFGDDGASLGNETTTLSGLSSTQWNRAFRRVTSDPVDVGYIDVSTTTPGGVFSVYGSVVDNDTNDPTTLLAVQPGNTFVAAAASAHGAQGSVWTTELEINNHGDEEVLYHLRLVPRGSAASSGLLSETFSLAPGRSIRYGDAWGDFAGQGGGSIEVITDEPDALLVTSRTFNTSDSGTFGQGIPGVRADRFFPTGETAIVTQLAQTGSFRSNLVLVNGSDHPTDLVVSFFTRSGVWLGVSRANQLPPGGVTQWNEAFSRVTENNVNDGFAVVEATTPESTFYVIGSVVDNRTGDPTTILPH